MNRHLRATRKSPLIAIIATLIERGALEFDLLRDLRYMIDLLADAAQLLDPHADGFELGELITAKLLSSERGASVYDATETHIKQHCSHALGTQLWVHAAYPTPTVHWDPMLTSSVFGGTAFGLRRHQQRAVYGDVVERVTAASLDPHASIRAYEVHTVSDWLQLLDASARPASLELENGLTVAVPDFQSLDDRWDAVHLSLAGFAALGRTYVPYQHGLTTAWPFEGEGTLWITPLFAASPFALNTADERASDSHYFTDLPWEVVENDEQSKPLVAVRPSFRWPRLARRHL